LIDTLMLKEIVKYTLLVWGGGLFLVFLIAKLLDVCGAEYDFDILWHTSLTFFLILYLGWVANAIWKHKRKKK
jgi:hypothetical protein